MSQHQGGLATALESLPDSPFLSMRDMGQHFSKCAARLTAHDVEIWRKYWSGRLHRSTGEVFVSDWLAEVFSAITSDNAGKLVVDVWAGMGFLAPILHEPNRAKHTLALTQSQEIAELGAVLAPEVEWKSGSPITLLQKDLPSIDVAVGILPVNARPREPLVLSASTGESIAFERDLGDQLLISASVRLSETGVGIFVVPSSFFSKTQSAFHKLEKFGLRLKAVLALPPGAFAPQMFISTCIVVVERGAPRKLFVAQLSSDKQSNRQTIDNLLQEISGNSLELGRHVDQSGFSGIDHVRAADYLKAVEKRFGARAEKLQALVKDGTAVRVGRLGENHGFQSIENAIYIPLHGSGEVVESTHDFILKPHHYAQAIIDENRSSAHFVALFLNSQVGRDLRAFGTTTIVPRLNRRTIAELPVFVPSLDVQHQITEIETRIKEQQNTIFALKGELDDLSYQLWAAPDEAGKVNGRVEELSKRLAAGLTQHASEAIERWFETLPFPLASILRAWQATPSQDYKTKCDHLLHFFEGAAEFFSVILLSAFSSNQALYQSHGRKLNEVLQGQHLSFTRATFGTWKVVVEYLGKQTREMLSDNWQAGKGGGSGPELCGEMFADPSLSLPRVIGSKEVAAVFATANKMRNDWSGHGGVVGQDEARLRNQRLLAEVQNLREACGSLFNEMELMYALHCRPRRGSFENEVAVLAGSNSEFLKESREMAMFLDVESLYLGRKGSARALRLLPLVQVGSSPSSAKNACYFFNRLDRDGARFISYHHADTPEQSGSFPEAIEAIRTLTEV